MDLSICDPDIASCPPIRELKAGSGGRGNASAGGAGSCPASAQGPLNA